MCFGICSARVVKSMQAFCELVFSVFKCVVVFACVVTLLGYRRRGEKERANSDSTLLQRLAGTHSHR